MSYPTRNFATLGPFNVVAHPLSLTNWLDRFRLALHVAMEVGLSHPRVKRPGV
jgi:hypothetical protein